MAAEEHMKTGNRYAIQLAIFIAFGGQYAVGLLLELIV